MPSAKPLLILVLLLVALLTPARAEDPTELVVVFQKQKDPAQLREDAEMVGNELSKLLGMPVKTVVPADYSATIQALVSLKADFAYVSAIPYLLAKRDGAAELLLAERRVDAAGTERTDYDSILVVHKGQPPALHRRPAQARRGIADGLHQQHQHLGLRHGLPALHR